MFCRNCGYQCGDTDNVCANCGTPLKQAPVNPNPVNPNPGYTPTPVNPNPGYTPTPRPAGEPVDLKKFVGIGMLVFGALAALIGFLTLIGAVSVSVSYYSFSSSVTVSDLYDGGTMFMISNILYGLILLASAAVAVLYGLKDMKNMPYYDQFLAKLPLANKPLVLAGGAAAVGGILQFILYMTESEGGASVSISWMSWVMIVLGAALVCVDMLVINKKK